MSNQFKNRHSLNIWFLFYLPKLPANYVVHFTDKTCEKNSVSSLRLWIVYAKFERSDWEGRKSQISGGSVEVGVD